MHGTRVPGFQETELFRETPCNFAYILFILIKLDLLFSNNLVTHPLNTPHKLVNDC